LDQINGKPGYAGLWPAKSSTLDLALLQQLSASLESQRESFERLVSTRRTSKLFSEQQLVVSGKHTSTGKPLLANDPHIPRPRPAFGIKRR